MTREQMREYNISGRKIRMDSTLIGSKTRYRGLMKQKIFALSRCLWVNHVRLALFELRMAA